MPGGKGKSSGGKSSGGKTSAEGQKKQMSHSERAGLQVSDDSVYAPAFFCPCRPRCEPRSSLRLVLDSGATRSHPPLRSPDHQVVFRRAATLRLFGHASSTTTRLIDRVGRCAQHRIHPASLDRSVACRTQPPSSLADHDGLAARRVGLFLRMLT